MFVKIVNCVMNVYFNDYDNLMIMIKENIFLPSQHAVIKNQIPSDIQTPHSW